MNKTDALSFLLTHQPLLPDRELTKETIEIFEQVRRFFLQQPDIDCIQPFLNSFGEGDGFGIYPLIGDVLRKLPKEHVVSGIAKALKSTRRSIRYWNAQLAAEFPSPELVLGLLALLKEEDYDLKYAALTALEQSAKSDAIPELMSFLNQESNDELRSLATEIMQSLRGH